MYRNSGKIIKLIANIFFFIGIGVSVIFAFAFLVTAADSWYDEEFFIMLACLSFFLGPVVSYLANLLLYGFGELIENTSMMKNTTNTINGRLDKIEDELNKGKKSNKEEKYEVVRYS